MPLVETQTGKGVIALRSDNGGEYTSQEFTEFLKVTLILLLQMSSSTLETKIIMVF